VLDPDLGDYLAGEPRCAGRPVSLPRILRPPRNYFGQWVNSNFQGSATLVCEPPLWSPRIRQVLGGRSLPILTWKFMADLPAGQV